MTAIACLWPCCAQASLCVLVILVDGWFVRPQRDPGATSVGRAALPRLAGYALVALSLAMLWRLFRYEAVDFSLMLVVVGAISAVIWGLDQAFFARRRKQARGGRRHARRSGCASRSPSSTRAHSFRSSCWCW